MTLVAYSINRKGDVLRQVHLFNDEPGGPGSRTYYKAIRAGQSLDGYYNHEWKRLVANHIDASTPLDADTISVFTEGDNISYVITYPNDPSQGTYHEDVLNWGWERANLNGTTNQSFDASLTSLATSRATIGFLNKARQEMTTFDGGTFIGELHEALDMLRHPAKSLFKAVRDWQSLVLSNKFAKLKKGTWRKTIADLWLEHSFGWKPFTNDIKDALTYLTDRKSELTFRVKPVKFRAQAEKGYVDVISDVQVGYGLSFRSIVSETVKSRYSSSAQIKGGVIMEVGNPFLPDLAKVGLDLHHLPGVLWELTPWSFLADYFSNIGQVINAWSFPTSRLAWSSLTERRIRTNLYVGVPVSYTINSGIALMNLQARGRQSVVYVYKRILRSSIDTSSVSLEIEGQVPGMSLKWLNIAALLNNRPRHSPK